MRKIYPDIQRLGGEVLVVSFAPPERVAAYLDKYPQPFPVVSDPALAAVLGAGRLLEQNSQASHQEEMKEQEFTG